MTARDFAADPSLRRGYRQVVRHLRRRSLADYVLLRGVTPPRFVRPLLTAYWFVLASDELTDTGPVAERAQRFEEWVTLTHRCLADGGSDDPRLAVFGTVVAETGLPVQTVDAYLDGVGKDITAYAIDSEDAFQVYVDRVAHPTLMLPVSVHPGCRGTEQAERLRPAAAALQRIDCLADLADDWRSGRPCLVRDPADLPAQFASAQRDLEHAATALPHLPPEAGGLLRAILDIRELQLRSLERAGPGLFDRHIRPPLIPSLRAVHAARRSRNAEGTPA
jgi:phytoene/squalene synthetase